MRRSGESLKKKLNLFSSCGHEVIIINHLTPSFRKAKTWYPIDVTGWLGRPCCSVRPFLILPVCWWDKLVKKWQVLIEEPAWLSYIICNHNLGSLTSPESAIPFSRLLRHTGSWWNYSKAGTTRQVSKSTFSGLYVWSLWQHSSFTSNVYEFAQQCTSHIHQ